MKRLILIFALAVSAIAVNAQDTTKVKPHGQEKPMQSWSDTIPPNGMDTTMKKKWHKDKNKGNKNWSDSTKRPRPDAKNPE